jgi:probable rRNA maturation factor
MSVSISHTTQTYPKLPYEAIKNAVLGKKYELSIVFIGARRARTLNKTTCGKTYVPNVLSFCLEQGAGELYLTPSVLSREATRFAMSERTYLAYLFIHGLLHLKGHHHGATMEQAEKQYLHRFGFLA